MNSISDFFPPLKNQFQKERWCWDVREQMRKALGVGDWQATRATTADSNDGNNNLTDDDNDNNDNNDNDNDNKQQKTALTNNWALVLCYDFFVLSASPPYPQGAIVASFFLVIFNILIHISRSNQQRRNLVMFLNFRDVHLRLSLWFIYLEKIQIPDFMGHLGEGWQRFVFWVPRN